MYGVVYEVDEVKQLIGSLLIAFRTIVMNNLLLFFLDYLAKAPLNFDRYRLLRL